MMSSVIAQIPSFLQYNFALGLSLWRDFKNIHRTDSKNRFIPDIITWIANYGLSNLSSSSFQPKDAHCMNEWMNEHEHSVLKL